MCAEGHAYITALPGQAEERKPVSKLNLYETALPIAESMAGETYPL
jgi:hypothetical protein